MSQDGKRFFYVNPLEVTPGISGIAQTHRHVLPERPKWFGCACCPPNVARLISSLELYAWSENDTTIFSNLYIGGEADFRKTKGCKLITQTEYPYGDKISYKVVTEDSSTDFVMAIRIPGWSDLSKTKLYYNKEELSLSDITKDGYAYVNKSFIDGDELILVLDMSAYRIYTSTLVHNNEGYAALQRGPLVYCLESVDNDGEVHSLRLSRTSEMIEVDMDQLFGGIKVLKTEGHRMKAAPELYSRVRPEPQPSTITAVPYYVWGNRGLGQMRVWIPEE
jgi:DUF1680 family protein